MYFYNIKLFKSIVKAVILKNNCYHSHHAALYPKQALQFYYLTFLLHDTFFDILFDNLSFFVFVYLSYFFCILVNSRLLFASVHQSYYDTYTFYTHF